jgi:hypothetical protein
VDVELIVRKHRELAMKWLAVGIGIFLLFSVSSYAKPIKLKNGSTINGKIVSSNKTSVMVEDEKGDVTSVPYDQVETNGTKVKYEQIKVEEKSQYRMYSLGLDLIYQSGYFQGVVPVLSGFSAGITFDIATSRTFSFAFRFNEDISTNYTIDFWTTNTNRHTYLAYIPGLIIKFYPVPSDISLINIYLGFCLDIAIISDLDLNISSTVFLRPALFLGNRFLFSDAGGFFIEPMFGIGISSASKGNGGTSLDFGNYFQFDVRFGLLWK